MSEGANNLEQEIAALSVQINEKKAALERERGSAVESGEALHHVVADMTGASAQVLVSEPKTNTQNLTTSTSYLDSLDPADAEKLNSYIDLIPSAGLKKTIERVKSESPYLLDAFHDCLVDKLKVELKSKNLI